MMTPDIVSKIPSLVMSGPPACRRAAFKIIRPGIAPRVGIKMYHGTLMMYTERITSGIAFADYRTG